MNARIIKSVVSGRLDQNPVMQGVLIKCLSKLEKRERGISSDRGRTAHAGAKELSLVEEAAMTLAICGSNRPLCAQLGMNATPIRIKVDDLPARGLPNPALAITNQQWMEENLNLADLLYPRGPEMKPRRLMVAMDATYLLKGLQQVNMRGQIGLIGGPWRPEDASQALLEIGSGVRRTPKAPQIMEFLAWDPMAKHSNPVSLTSMPMALKVPKRSENGTLTHAGNWEAW